MTSVARRHQQLTAEITRLDTMLDELVRHAFPEGFLAKQALTTAGVATRLGGSNRRARDRRALGCAGQHPLQALA